MRRVEDRLTRNGQGGFKRCHIKRESSPFSLVYVSYICVRG